MGSKAGKTATGWRRRYLVQVWDRAQRFEVLLVRGSAKRVRKGVQRVLILTGTDKWEWYEIDSEPYTYSIGRKFFEADARDEMLALVTGLRLRGFTPMREVPSW